MNLFTCRTGRFLRGTALIAIVFFFINATLLSLKFSRSIRQDSEDNEKGNLKTVAHSTLTGKIHDRNIFRNQTSIPDSPFPHTILYRNTYWQVHRSYVCHEDKNVSSKSTKCPPNKNNIKNLSSYDELVAYSSFYDDRSTPASPRWIQVLAVVKMGPQPSPIYCQIWLRNNSTLTNESEIMDFLTSHGKTSKSLEMTLSRVHLNESNIHSMSGKPPTWMYEVQSDSHTTGRNHNFGNLSYGQRQFSCPMNGVHPSLLPSHVSLTFNRGERSTILLPVQYPVNNRLQPLDDVNKNKQINNNNNIITTTNNNNNNIINNNNNNNKNSPPYQHEFVVCVTQAYGHVNPMELIEWMEFHKILGVTKINIYNGTVRPDETLESVLRHYTETGFLSLYQIPPAVLNQSNAIEATKLSSPASLNDCMMRHMKSARWVIVVDFDEVILPTEVDSYAALMEQLKEVQKNSLKTKKSSKNEVQIPNKVILNQSVSKLVASPVSGKESPVNKPYSSQSQHRPNKRSVGVTLSKVTGSHDRSGTDDELTPHTYVFRMAYFLRNSKLNNSTTSSNETLFTSRYRWRSPHLDDKISPKSFVDPRHCLSVFNHWCFLTWAGKAQKKFIVDPELAFVRHYRKSCSLNKEQCIKLAAENVLDKNADRFQKRLLEQVTRAKKDIFK